MKSPPDRPPGLHAAKRLTLLQQTLLCLVMIGIGFSAWQMRYWIFPKRFGVVVEGRIFRSGQLSRFLVKPTLEKHRIRTIVDLSGLSADHPDQLREQQTAAELGIHHHHLSLSGDGTGDIENYAQAIELIDHSQRAGNPVLVHCAAGSQRTGGVVAAYRLLVQKRPSAEVLQELQTYSWNPKTDQALLRYLDSHWSPLVQSLIRRGVLDAPPEKLPQLISGK